MLHVLRHYLPIRKFLLIVSETALLTWAVYLGVSSHLWKVDDTTLRLLANESLSPGDARLLCLVSALTIAVVSQFAMSFNELYDFRVSNSPHARAARFVSSAGSAIGLSLAVVLLAEIWQLERVLALPGMPLTHKIAVLTISLVVGFALLYLWRNLFHFLLRRYDFSERVLVLGNGRVAQRLAREIMGRPNTGYQIVGMVADPSPQRRSRDPRGRRASDRVAPPTGPATLWKWQSPLSTQEAGGGGAALAAAAEPALRIERPGPSPAEGDGAPKEIEIGSSLIETVHRLGIDDIVVALEDRRGVLPIDELLQCRVRGVVVEEAEALFERITGKIAVEAMRPSYLIFNPGFHLHPLAEFGKRLLDVSLSLLALLLTWPLMLATAIAVRLDSPGPILFRQERTGRFGKPFTLLKFRSMREDAEASTGPVWAQQNDPRITRVGRLLRRVRLDELPQLLNVLAGSMSLVGPRPERPHFVEDLSTQIPYFHQRHMVKPGVTGWAQINYPYGSSVEDALQKLQYDIFYIKYQSLLFDLSILFNTIKIVVLRKGT